ncbi:hypothetical protein A3Q56_01436 [Intoshia linei]|uniref:Lipoyl-binding domain-containing protein n=1 Tax=Intoshia linei TaxID=1819745 RepID=A0A177B944_9BILA|nr:hypothetical protein A3Q56_01436 [Intoshia linei]
MDGNYSTNYIKECYPDGFKGRKITRQVIADLSHIVAAIWMRNEMQYDSTLRKHNVCVNCLDLKEHIEEFEIAEENSETFQIHNKEVILQFDSKIKKHSKLNVNLTYKNQCKKYVIEVLGWSNDGNIQLKYEGKQINWNILAQHISQYAHIMKPIKKYINDSILTAPMPGIVKRINVNIGDKILKGSEVCVLEAMKMQNGLYSKVDGTVSKICVNVNDSVNESDILIEYSN